MKKNGGKKSRDAIPLRPQFNFQGCTYILKVPGVGPSARFCIEYELVRKQCVGPVQGSLNKTVFKL
jgi:hypothetical protein